MKKPTKEELIIKVAELERANELFVLDDQSKRKEFAKAFRWYKASSPYRFNDSEEVILPTWEQVWVRIGSLLNDRDLVDLTEKQMQLSREHKKFREWITSKEQKPEVIK